MKLSCLGLVVSLLVLLAAAEGAIVCNSVYLTISPCLSYISSGALDPKCCPAAKSVARSANTKPDRQRLCGCMKSLAATYTAKVPRANQLLKTCGITLNFPLSPAVDCSRVN